MKFRTLFPLFMSLLTLTPAWARPQQDNRHFPMAGAKGEKLNAYWEQGLVMQHKYDFEGAIESLGKCRDMMPAESPWIAQVDSVLAECQIGLRALHHTQQVVVMDSMLVSRDKFFAYYRLGAESGRLLADGQFENQVGDYRMYGAADAEGNYHLYEQHRFGANWDAPRVVASIESHGAQLCYPFLRTDGETLYFASNQTPGMGGFDIYKTHYNADAESYYQPERLDMPFNSPFDDYLLAVDESHQVGWWATNRNTKADQVCIYLFRISEVTHYLDTVDVSLARLDRIADTWQNPDGYADVVESLLKAPQKLEVHQVLRIPISDRVIYTSVEQFHNPKAKSAYQKSVQVQQELASLCKQLDRSRIEWHSASEERRRQLRPIILQQENDEVLLRQQLARLCKEYRSLEVISLQE